jgi:hypothetical protein
MAHNKIIKIFFNLSLLFFSQPSFSQQFSFKQLIEMTNDYKLFEIKMIKELNQVVQKRNVITYSYSTNNGGFGASKLIPTNDSKYEPIYKFNDGRYYKESEINDRKLDEDFKIRNNSSKDGRIVNESEIEGYSYVKDKITSLIKGELIEISFAENLDNNERVASTWYNWESKNFKKILTHSNFFSPNYKKITIQYVRDSDFRNILNQVISVSKYMETKEEDDSFISKYKFNNHSITSERRENGIGGIITIYVEQPHY